MKSLFLWIPVLLLVALYYLVWFNCNDGIYKKPPSTVVQPEVSKCALLNKILFDESSVQRAVEARRAFETTNLIAFLESQLNQGPLNPLFGGIKGVRCRIDEEMSFSSAYAGARRWHAPAECEPTIVFGHQIFDFLGPVADSSVCRDGIESYGVGDSEKRVCGLSKLVATNSAVTNTGTVTPAVDGFDCVVLSIGSNNEWGFESEIYERTKCIIHTFDCTCKGRCRVPASLADRVFFHPICLGVRSEVSAQGHEFVSYSDLLKLIGLNEAPTHLKMDIEGFEWPILVDIVTSSRQRLHLLPVQISLELHTVTPFKELEWYNRRRSHMEVYAFMSVMFRVGGYVLIDRHDNELCAQCSEIVIARLVCT